MPTARELLEQADALMRRNRQEAERGSRQVPPPAEIRAPVVPIDAGPRIDEPKAVPPRSDPAPTISAKRPADDADIPVLDDIVDATDAPVTDDDFPLLTDAIDEIDVAAPVVDEGEPSDWLTPPSEDESVLGPSPPSVVLVPPATTSAPQVARGHAPPKPAGAGDERRREIEPRSPPPELEDLPHTPVESDDPEVTVRRPVPTLGAPIASIRTVPPEIEDLAESGLADLDPDVTWTRPVTPAPRPAGLSAPVTPPIIREAVGVAPPAIVETAPAAMSDATARAMPTGGEWDALAEEIRMQVLQRIDLFTDTGLRERLGERLKPIVDRASADLVDAINQHVGELLRAYVAEAIEREIDRWRAGR